MTSVTVSDASLGRDTGFEEVISVGASDILCRLLSSWILPSGMAADRSDS